MTTQEQVAAILTGWTVTTCADNGAFWTIGGLDPYGRAHSGSRADPIELAHDLARLVEPPPPIEIDPTPEPVQPTVLVEASAGVEELSPSAPAAPPVEEPVEMTDAQRVAYAGTMLQHDRENYLRGLITVRVTQIEKARLAGRYDRNAQDRQIWGWTSFQNLSAQELPIPDDVQNAYDEFLLANAWERATKDHAAALRDAAITVELQMLEAMLDQVSEGWP